MSKKYFNIRLIAFLGFLALIALLYVFFKKNGGSNQNFSSERLGGGSASYKGSSVGNERLKKNHKSYQIVKTKIDEKNASETPFSFDAEFIYSALTQVEIDDNDDVVIDSNARKNLEWAFKKMTFDLGLGELEELQELIRFGVGGKPGEQVAKIVYDYYHYRKAESDFMSTSYGSDLDSIMNHLEQIEVIRESHLGFDVANKLYGEEQKNNRYTLESMRIQSDETLTQKEKDKRQKSLLEKHKSKK